MPKLLIPCPGLEQWGSQPGFRNSFRNWLFWALPSPVAPASVPPLQSFAQSTFISLNGKRPDLKAVRSISLGCSASAGIGAGAAPGAAAGLLCKESFPQRWQGWGGAEEQVWCLGSRFGDSGLLQGADFRGTYRELCQHPSLVIHRLLVRSC